MCQYLNQIKSALTEFYRKDRVLLDSKRKTHEQTVSFRLAHYLAEQLEGEYSGLFVDCEYHGDINNLEFRKEIEVNGQSERIRPDIIYHDRDRNNKFCIEVKLRSPREDILKVKTFIRAYDYLEGYCLCNISQTRCTLICFTTHNEQAVYKYIWDGERLLEKTKANDKSTNKRN